jgi:hypothetical protein
MLRFFTDSSQTVKVVTTCDPEVLCDDTQRQLYLESGDIEALESVGEGATCFTLKALSPSEREQAEVRAGALQRSELGRLLWSEAPSNSTDRARWHHELSDDEREAMAEYQAYLSRVYLEMIRGSLVHIDGEEASVEQLNMIRPDSHRIQVISELVLHIQRISLLGIEGK